MKHPKPGFKAYFKKRISDPFKFTDEMIIEDGRGQRFWDAGSPHTLIIKSFILLSVLMILFVFNWTADGSRDVIFIGVFLLFLHRFFRYFWTDFERVDEEGKPIEDKSLLYVRKRRERSNAYNKLIKLIGEDETPSEDIYYRYRWWQRILIFLEVMLAFGLIIMIPAVTSGSPYSRLYTAEIENPDFDFIKEIYSADGTVTVPDLERGKIYLKDADTLLKAYAQARSYIDTFCPEAEINDYAVEFEDGDTTYHFTFKNFRRGLIYKKDYVIMHAEVNANESWMKVYYWSYYAIESAFDPIDPPDKEIDIEKILGIILRETGKTKDDLEYCYIGAQTVVPGPEDNYDPGGDTWFAEVHFKDMPCIVFTVNLADDTAAGMVWG